MKNKEQYIFTETASGDRTNIMSSFPLWDKEMFLQNVKKDRNYGRYRYGKIGGYVSLLKDMYLEEFELVFSADEFTTKEVTMLFRKEISEKYGEHAEKAKIKPISKKDLERGCIYKDFSGKEWVYYGEVKKETDSTYSETYQSDKKPIETERGYGFDRIWGISSYKPDGDIEVLKTPKKIMEKVGCNKIILNTTYSGKSWRGAKITLDLL